MLINKDDVHVRLSEIHEVAANKIRPKDVTVPIKKCISSKASFLKGVVSRIDFEHRHILTDVGTIDYDYLILAVGSEPEFFGVLGMKEHGFTLWSLDDAKNISAHVEKMFATALKERDGQKRKELLTFVIGGGGLTGVEMASELAERFVYLSKRYNVPQDEINLIMVEALPDILPALKPNLIEDAKKVLISKGLQLKINSPIVRVSPTGLTLKSGERIATRTLIWTGGIRGNSFIEKLGLPTGGRGRIKVNEYLQTACPDVYAIGDCAHLVIGDTPVPQQVEVAFQTADCAAHNIMAEIRGYDKRKYRPEIYGTVVSIGSRYGIADFGLISFTGFPAILLKRIFDVYYLISLGCFRLALEYIAHRIFARY
jgi:NADH dehydrogenase